MKIRKLFCAVLALCLLLALPMGASAAEVASGTCGENLTWVLDDTGTLTISGTGEMEDYYFDGSPAPWCEYGSDITDVVVEDGVTGIGSYAFFNCDYITDIDIADSVSYIGEYAFHSLFYLKELELPAGLTELSSGLFFQSGLEKIVIPGNIEVIGQGAFHSCYYLSDVVISEGVSVIGPTAFAHTSRIAEITIPKSVTTIGVGAFSVSSILETVIFEGDAPEVKYVEGYGYNEVFEDVSCTVYYPADNATWTEEARSDIGSEVTWVPYSSGISAPVVKGTNVAKTGKIKLTWEAVEGAVKYDVYRSTSKTGEYTKLKTTTGTSFTNTSAKAGTTYYYYVVAVAEDGTKSENSAIVTRTCDCARPVVKVTNVVSSGKIKLTWEAVDGAVKYQVYRSTSKTGEYKLMKTTTGTSYTNTSAKAGTQYYYKVKALGSKDAAASAYSEVVTRTCDYARPVVSVSNVASSGKIKLTWEKVDGATKYEVYRSTSKTGTYTLLKTTTGTSFTNTSAKAGTTYYYKVRAIGAKSAAASAYSAVVTRTGDLAQPKVSITLNSSGKPKLTWDKVDGAVSYKVYRATSKNGTYSLMKTTTGTAYTNTGAAVSGIYYYKVKAICEKSAGNSAYSEVDFITCSSVGISGSVLDQSFMRYVNEYRSDSTTELTWYEGGEMAALIRAAEAAATNSTYRPDGSSPEPMWDAYGVFIELDVYGTSRSAEMVDAIMSDEDLFALFMMDEWESITCARNGDYWAIMFIEKEDAFV